MLTHLLLQCRRVVGRERGQGLVEYGLILALVAVVVIGALLLVGNQIQAVFTNIANSL
jgi:pilus assembly protein Flp/PilA